MGLLDAVVGMATGGNTGGGSPLMNIAMQLLSNSQNGGLQGLVQQFQKSGLGEQVASWVGTGSNLPISGDQIAKAFSGGGQLGQIASKLGISENDAAGGLAGMLPGLIDKLTPDGKVPEGDIMAQGLDLLKGKLFGA